MKLFFRKFIILLFVLSSLGSLQAAAGEFDCLPAEIRTELGISTLYVDGQPVMPMSFCSRNNTDERYLKSLLDAGIKVHFPVCDTEWKDPRGFEKLSLLAHRILKYDPQAVLILRLSLDPPDWWLEENLDECTRFENGEVKMIIDKKIGRTYDPRLTDNLKFSLASLRWQQEAERALENFVLKVGASDFGRRVAGYFFTASETEEWYYTVRYDRRYHVHDFSPPMLAYFKDFLRRKYKTDRALAAAWNNEVRDFESVRIPQLQERTLYTGVGEILLARFDSRSHFGTLANPGFSEFESDYYRAVNQSVADAIIRFSKKVKELSDGRLLTGVFYGALCCVVYHEMGVSAAAHKIQDSGVVDICCSPATYFNRAVGGQATTRSPFSSYNLRRMLWLTEEDTRTHLCDFGNWVRYSQAADAWESCAMIKRDMAKILTQHHWAWWFENSRADRWYDSPEIISTFKRIQELFEASRRMRKAREEKRAEIAMLASEPSIYYTDHESLRDMLMWQRELEFERIGAPYDYYYVRDLAHPDMPDYKLYVFLNAVSLGDAGRRAIREKVAAGGATALWLYAPGLINPDAGPKLAVSHMEELTGFDFDFKRGNFRPRIVINDPRHPLVRSLPRDKYFGRPTRAMFGSFETRYKGHLLELTASLTDPLFYLADSTQAAGAIFAGENLPAIGETERAGYRSIYLGAKYAQAEFLRAAAVRAGVHIYCDSDDIFYADNDFAVIHAAKGGVKTLRFPQQVDLYEVFENKFYGRGVREISFPMEFGQTRVFCLQGKI